MMMRVSSRCLFQSRCLDVLIYKYQQGAVVLWRYTKRMLHAAGCFIINTGAEFGIMSPV